LAGADADGLHKILQHDLDPMRSVGPSDKADPPPVVDADAVLTRAKQLAPRVALDISKA